MFVIAYKWWELFGTSNDLNDVRPDKSFKSRGYRANFVADAIAPVIWLYVDSISDIVSSLISQPSNAL